MNADGSGLVDLTNDSADDSDPDWQPVVQCTLSCSAAVPSNGLAGAAVSFTGGAAASGTGCGPVSFYWDFGDGQTSTQQSPAHVYSDAGTYGWHLTVSASGASPCTQAGSITINPGGAVPSHVRPRCLRQERQGQRFHSRDCAALGGLQSAHHIRMGVRRRRDVERSESGTHYVTTGTYSWTLTASAAGASPCTSSGTINIVTPGSCVVSCTTKVPATGSVNKAVKFSGTGKTSAIARRASSPTSGTSATRARRRS